ncbi:NAD(P)-dependent alcohol dehydrogenase [Dactylosporangium vinaceum]|uniref:NAD(P)-dependent alcohol dehydrogenase n=1 Tax=Dactylosporangium vinaceum TaxID=53362 RepID=A0ABV5LZJ6_9ACTN|nr:NAD(P)-dependent alcohol dehydrogenase [Dactylosporangium vinaceum]UAB92593.1 NAD(P)-dependent alcohol dehydrogenase [Dactylosporangium vinaceum]
MKAIVQERYGPPSVLRYAEVATPVPAADEVLVRVHAAGVNAADWHMLRGDPKLARLTVAGFGLRGPKQSIPGRDFAGVVESAGSAVEDLSPGDEVYGTSAGAFAEYVCAKSGTVARKPAGLTFEEAAALPLAGVTALGGLRDLAAAQPGGRLLVNGASGGVGMFAVQLAKAMGLHVTGVCSTRNLELVTGFGADEVIDYTRHDFTRGGRRYDVVFDLVANRSLAALRRAVTPAGVLILAGGGVYTGGSLVGPMGLVIVGLLTGRLVRQRIVLLAAAPDRERLDTLREYVEAGHVRPVIERTYPLHRAAAAITHLETEHARAKIVITCRIEG